LADAITGQGGILITGSQTLTVTYPGYAPADVRAESKILSVVLTRNSATTRASSLVLPADADKDASLSLLVSREVTGLRAVNAGSADVLFNCEQSHCSAAAMARRPGHYDLVAALDGGQEANLRNGLLLAESVATDVVLDGDTVTLSAPDVTRAWLVGRGGGRWPLVRAGAVWSATVPASPENIDLAYTARGQFFSQTLRTGPRQALGAQKGCVAQDQTPGICLGAVLWLACRSHGRRRKHT
jgi:hypothetical protein